MHPIIPLLLPFIGCTFATSLTIVQVPTIQEEWVSTVGVIVVKRWQPPLPRLRICLLDQLRLLPLLEFLHPQVVLNFIVVTSSELMDILIIFGFLVNKLRAGLLSVIELVIC